jgi:hypothetical protein
MSSDALSSSAPSLPLWLRVLVWTAIMTVLLAVFALYTQPDFMLTLADQIWACF